MSRERLGPIPSAAAPPGKAMGAAAAPPGTPAGQKGTGTERNGTERAGIPLR